MHKKWMVCGALAVAISGAAAAKDIRDQWDVKISKAELVFPNAQPQAVATAVKEAISQFAIPASLSYLPTSAQPTARPGAPSLKRLSAISQEYVCDGAFAEIRKTPPPVENAFAFIREGHHVCLYEFEKGVKAYVMYYNIKKLESLTSGLFGGITRAIRGSDEDRATQQLQENIGWIREKLPNVLVEKIDVPGKPVEAPDAAAVAALIPAVVAAQPVAAQVVATAPVASAVAAAPAQNSAQTKIEARKHLTAMGMTYHSQSQFFEAIERQDDVAVQLFLDSGGIQPEAKNAKGKTALQLAQATGNAQIVALLSPKAQPAPASMPAAATPAVVAAASSTTPALLQKSAGGGDVDFSAIPADVLADMDGEILKMGLSSEDQATVRANLARQYLQARALAKSLQGMNRQ